MSKNKVVKLDAYFFKNSYALGDPIFEDGEMSESQIESPNSGPGLVIVWNYLDRTIKPLAINTFPLNPNRRGFKSMEAVQ